MAKCKNCKYFYKRPDITMFTCAEGKPHEDNTVIDCDNYAPMTNADRIRSMTDEELLDFLCSIETYEQGSAMTIENGVAMCSVKDVEEWLRAESEG